MSMLRPARVHLAGGVLAAFALAIVLAACSAGTTPATSSSPAASASAQASASMQASASTQASPAASGGAGGSAVAIQGFAFGPQTLDVATGTTVTWTNKDPTTHTVTANDGSFDGQVPSGQMFSQTFSKAGTFAYHCRIHPSMTATITVH